MTTTTYESDIVAWANEQVRLIREGRLSELDLENIAEEIADVGKSETRELASRMSVLLTHLLKWHYQPELRTSSQSWSLTIAEQRRRLNARLRKAPSLKTSLQDEDWLDDTWVDAVALARKETGIVHFPKASPWSMSDVLTEGWLPIDAVNATKY